MSKTDVLKGRQGIVTSYRRGKHVQHPNQVLLQFEGVASEAEAVVLIGRSVKWVSQSGREFLGKVLAAHGGSGAVRAKFRANLPGQAIGTRVALE